MKKRKKTHALKAEDIEATEAAETKMDVAETSKNLVSESNPDQALEDEKSDRYRAAAVAFFTRSKTGAVDKVLVALEERKVQASLVGLDQKGKVNVDMIIFPMGRRERKDKNDCVETAKREYIEETTNYRELAKYLDFADFTGDDADREGRGPDEWTGKQNLALFFAPAAMVVLFCEVPASARNCSAVTITAPESASKADKETEATGKKKRKNGDEAMHKPSPNYHVGKRDHLQPFWIDASELKKIADSTEKAPVLRAKDKDCHFFPTSASALRLPEARAFFGLPLASKKAPSV
jgi:hypothetical protein